MRKNKHIFAGIAGAVLLACMLLITACGSTRSLIETTATVEWDISRQSGEVDYVRVIDIAYAPEDDEAVVVVDPTPTTIVAPKTVVLSDRADLSLAPDSTTTEGRGGAKVEVSYTARIDSGRLIVSIDEVAVEHPEKTSTLHISEHTVVENRFYRKTTFILIGVSIALIAVVAVVFFIWRKK